MSGEPKQVLIMTTASSCSGHEVDRSYTPVQSLHTLSSVRCSHDHLPRDTLQLMIKLYHDGAMSKHLSKLKEGDSVFVSDPQGVFDVARLEPVTDAVLIAAGSGETPPVAHCV